MKTIVLLAIIGVSALDASPFFGLGLGRLGGQYGHFMNGRGYGRRHYNNGASGLGEQGYGSNAINGYHNIGGHHSRQSSIQSAENSGFHNIGGGSAMNSGGYNRDGFNNYADGDEGYGHGFGEGSSGSMF